MAKNAIIKTPIEKLGYNFIRPEYLPVEKDEYYLRNIQNRSGINYRNLTAYEIEALVKNRNTSDDWNKILVSDAFNPDLVRNCKFFGLIRIGKLEPCFLEFSDMKYPVGFYNSIIVSSDFGDNVAIENVNYLSHYIIGNEVIIANTNELATTDHAKFGNGIIKDGEDEYKIQLRYTDLLRNNVTDLLNMRITFMDMNTMRVKSIPVSAVATVDYTSTTGGVKRKNVKRTIQLQSNVLDPTMVGKVNAELQVVIDDFKQKAKIPADVNIKLSGQSEQEKETQKFLLTAFIIAIGMIFLILVLQFNSMSKPFIVVTEIFFSVIGVLLGYAITGMTIATIMLLVGIVGLAGIVIKNGILLIEFTDELRGRGMRTREAAIQAGKIRIIPVLLTAVATILGLLPLAVGFNIDFVSLFQDLNPKIFFGGDSVVFWGPLSWTIIFGLIFAFFLTLMMVPSMYLIAERLRRPMERFYGTKWVALLGFAGPFFFIFVGIMYLVRKIQGKPVWLGKPAYRKAG